MKYSALQARHIKTQTAAPKTGAAVYLHICTKSNRGENNRTIADIGFINYNYHKGKANKDNPLCKTIGKTGVDLVKNKSS